MFSCRGTTTWSGILQTKVFQVGLEELGSLEIIGKRSFIRDIAIRYWNRYHDTGRFYSNQEFIIYTLRACVGELRLRVVSQVPSASREFVMDLAETFIQWFWRSLLDSFVGLSGSLEHVCSSTLSSYRFKSLWG
jgi:hypothetical protein